MQFGIRSKVVILFGCLLAMSFANFLILKHAEEDASGQLLSVDHTHQVLSKSEQLLGCLRDAETGQRGYLLTGEADYLAPYASGISKTRGVLRELRALTMDNPDQQLTLERVSDLINRKLIELAATIEHARAGDRSSALAIVKQDIGKNLMDQIRIELDRFQAIEQQLLVEQKVAFKKSQHYLELLFALEALVLIILIIGVSFYVQKKLVAPITALAAVAQKRDGNPSRFTAAYNADDEIGALSRALANMHGMLIERNEKLEELSKKLEQQRDHAMVTSTLDVLTGLHNRRKFEHTFKQELRRSRREKSYLNLTLLDIDFFKKVNDTYGHSQGDEVLKKVAHCIHQLARRPSDFTFRIGGEEFVFLSSGQTPQEARSLIDELRMEIENMRLPNEGSSVCPFVTLSAGVVSQIPEQSDTTDSLLKLADQRLYKAKSQGRNRVVAVD